jgi:tRNA dimethylallyltransferase
VGKTRLAVALAQRLGGELLSADSRQVYRGLDIGTNKATAAELHGVPQHLVDVCDPEEPFTVADFQRRAWAVLAEVLARGRLPILVGGSGLYVRAVVDGLNFAGTGPDPQRRARWEALAEREGVATLHARLHDIDPEAAARIHPTDRRRLIRALEVFETSGAPLSALQTITPPPFAALLIGLTAPRELLYRWINERVHLMVQRGLQAETTRLLAARISPRSPALEGIGYAEMALVTEGRLTVDAAIERMARATRRYAKRQWTWFRSDSRVRWFDARTVDLAAVEEFVREGLS